MPAKSRPVWVILVASVGAAIAFAANAEPMKFRTASSGGTLGESWIVADGEIVASTPDDFQAFLGANPDTNSQGIGPGRTEVYLNSPGGNLIAGLQLGELIRKYQFGTYVGRSIPDPTGSVIERDEPGRCASACSFAFLGGVWRRAVDQTIGVHQYFLPQAREDPLAIKYNGRDLSDEQRIEATLVDYVVHMGVDARFLVPTALTAPQDIHMLTSDEMDEYDVTFDDTQYGDWAFEPYKDGLIAFARTPNGDSTATIFCRKSDHVLRLLVNSPYRGISTDIHDMLSHVSATLFGVELSGITGKLKDGRLILEFRIPNSVNADQTEMFGLSGDDLDSRYILNHKLRGANFDLYAKFVKRNCS